MKRIFLSYSIILAFIMVGCSTSEKSVNNTGLSIRLTQGKLDVAWQNIVRITGGRPMINESNFSPKKIEEKNGIFTFIDNNKSIDISIRTTEHENIIGLYLHVDSSLAIKGNDFIGLFFEDMPSYNDGVAFWRYKPWNSWTKPIKISAPSKLEDWDVQFYYWQYKDGMYGAAIPLSDNGYRTTFGSEENNFGSKAISYLDGHQTSKIPSMAIGFGKDPYKLFEELYEEGLKMMDKEKNLRKNKTYPEIFDYAGWCTWNASNLGKNLNSEFIINSVKSFTDNDFPMPWIIIDDGWLQFSKSPKRLTSLKPNNEKFPTEFKPLINKLKNEYGIKYVGAWHTINGYWSGIDINSEIGKKYEKSMFSFMDQEYGLIKTEGLKPCYMISPFSDTLSLFYDEWYTYLKDQGIDFVKVDNQLSIEKMAKGNFPIQDFAEQIHNKLNQAVNKHFNGTIINCMDMTNDAFYNFGTTAIARSVEDYFPYEEDENYNLQKGNAAAHVTQALYNTIYFQQMVWPDFDLFQSHNPNATFHAIARAISGGPIYFTDIPNKQNFDLLWPLIYKNGKIIRADIPARLTDDCLFMVQDTMPTKAYSLANNSALLAIWNAADADVVNGNFKISDIKLLNGNKFIVYEHFSKTHQIYSKEKKLPIELKRMQYLYYNIVPIKNKIALIGLINKFNAPKTILNQSISKEGTILATLYEGGEFAAYLPNKPTKILVDENQANDYYYENNWLQINLPHNTDMKPIQIKIELN